MIGLILTFLAEILALIWFSTARKKYDTEFKKIRTEALKMKSGLSEDSPRQEIYAFSEFLRVKEDELRELAGRLIAEMS